MHLLEQPDGYHIKLHQAEKNFSAALKIIKTIKGREWKGDTKTWFIPKARFNSLADLENKLVVELSNREVVKQLKLTPIQELPQLTVDVDKLLKKIMRPFQRSGTAYCLDRSRCIIGDQQGLGKTIQAIAATMIKDQWPGLVISKNSLRANWQAEWEAWTDKRVTIFSDSLKHTWPHLFDTGFFDVGIVNFESLQKYFVKAIKIPPGEQFRLHHIYFYQWISLFKWIIVDESHYVKDMNTRRTKITAGLCQGKENVYLLSGTPALNHPMEVYTQICIMNKQEHFGNMTTFKNTWVGKKNKANLPALNRLLTQHCYFRRIKSEVAPELPSKTRQIILCDIDNREEYDRCEKDFELWMRNNPAFTTGMIDGRLRAEALTRMMELKKIAARGKMGAVKEWVDSMIDQDEKFVLFAYHQEIQEKIFGMADNMVRFGGGLDAATIAAKTKKFNEDPTCFGCVASISADSEGHNWQIASVGGHTELPWHFGKCEQGEDRIHRIGTLNPVNWYYFLAEKTIDRKIYSIIMEKKDMHDQITGTNEDIETRTIDRVLSLFNQR